MPPMAQQHDIWNTPQAAQYIGIKPGTLAKWRRHGHGPRFLRIGHNTVRYRKADVDAFLESRAQGGKA